MGTLPFIVAVGVFPFGVLSAYSLPSGGLPGAVRVGKLKDECGCVYVEVSMFSATIEGIIQGPAASRSRAAEGALRAGNGAGVETVAGSAGNAGRLRASRLSG